MAGDRFGPQSFVLDAFGDVAQLVTSGQPVIRQQFEFRLVGAFAVIRSEGSTTHPMGITHLSPFGMIEALRRTHPLSQRF